MQFHTPRRLDSVHAVEFLAGHVSYFYSGRLHACIVERRVKTTEGGYSLRNHRCYLRLVRDIAPDANRLVTGGDESFRRRANGILVNVG